MKLFEIPIYYRSREQASKDKHWRTYDYNEIIGWVTLHTRSNAIRAEYWLTIQKPSKVLIKKEFYNIGKLFKIGTLNLTNKEIFNKLMQAFKDMQENSQLSKYYFDLEAFKAIGKHIKWQNIVQNKSA